MAMRGLPSRLLALDIETEKTRLRKVEESVLAVVGVVPYSLNGTGAYERGPYRYFLRDELPQLYALLAGFTGLIIGQNILDFDYRVLRPHMPLAGIIEKTFDLFLFLDYIDPEKRSRLSLEVLAQRNLYKQKLFAKDDISALWRAGEVKKVLRRNESDCELVAELWMMLARDRELKSKLRIAGEREQLEGDTLIRVEARHLPIVLGKQPFLTHDAWLERLTTWGNARRDPKTGGKTFVEERIPEGDLALFHKLRCPHCHRHFVLHVGRSHLIKPRASKVCPFCRRRVTLARGTTLLGRDGEARYFVRIGNYGRIRKSWVPTEESARRFIRGLRFWSY